MSASGSADFFDFALRGTVAATARSIASAVVARRPCRPSISVNRRYASPVRKRRCGRTVWSSMLTSPMRQSHSGILALITAVVHGLPRQYAVHVAGQVPAPALTSRRACPETMHSGAINHASRSLSVAFSIAGNAMASPTSNGPTPVRRSAVRWARQVNASAMSSASVSARMYLCCTRRRFLPPGTATSRAQGCEFQRRVERARSRRPPGHIRSSYGHCA